MLSAVEFSGEWDAVGTNQGRDHYFGGGAIIITKLKIIMC